MQSHFNMDMLNMYLQIVVIQEIFLSGLLEGLDLKVETQVSKGLLPALRSNKFGIQNPGSFFSLLLNLSRMCNLALNSRAQTKNGYQVTPGSASGHSPAWPSARLRRYSRPAEECGTIPERYCEKGN